MSDQSWRDFVFSDVSTSMCMPSVGNSLFGNSSRSCDESSNGGRVLLDINEFTF